MKHCDDEGMPDDVPDWSQLTDEWARKFVNEQNLPYGAGKDSGKDKAIREAFHVFIRANNLLKLIATQAYEAGYQAGRNPFGAAKERGGL